MLLLDDQPLKMAVLLLSVFPPLDHCLLHLHNAHTIGLPMYLPQASASDYSSFRSELQLFLSKGNKGHAPPLVSLATDKPTWHQFPITGSQPLPTGAKKATLCYPIVHHTWWGVPQGSCFRCVSSTHSLNC